VTSSLLLLTAAAAHAEPHGAAAGAHHGPAITNLFGMIGHPEAPALVWLAVTFLIFAAAVFRFAKAPVMNHVVSRSDTVQRALDEAKRAKEAAEARAQAAEARLAALDGEVKRMHGEFEAQGKLEASRIEEAAKLASARIMKDAEDTIVAETQRSMEALRTEAAALALQQAEVRIRAALKSDDDVRLQSSLMQDLRA
jgi:F-type H+-transporting ATPase subunit b